MLLYNKGEEKREREREKAENRESGGIESTQSLMRAFAVEKYRLQKECESITVGKLKKSQSQIIVIIVSCKLSFSLVRSWWFTELLVHRKNIAKERKKKVKENGFFLHSWSCYVYYYYCLFFDKG